MRTIILCALGAILAVLVGCASHYRYIEDVDLRQDYINVKHCEYSVMNIPFVVAHWTQPTCEWVTHNYPAKG